MHIVIILVHQRLRFSTAKGEEGETDRNPSLENIEGFKWGSCCSIYSFLCSILYIIVCPYVNICLLATALSVLLRFTTSEYLFGILKLYFIHTL